MHGFIDLVLLYLGVVSNVHSIFVHHSSTGTIVLIVYVDDIIIIKSDSTGLAHLKRYLGQQFHTKDLSSLSYFIGIEVACFLRYFLSNGYTF